MAIVDPDVKGDDLEEVVTVAVAVGKSVMAENENDFDEAAFVVAVGAAVSPPSSLQVGFTETKFGTALTMQVSG